MKRAAAAPTPRGPQSAGAPGGGSVGDSRPRRGRGTRLAWFAALALIAAVLVLREPWGRSQAPHDPYAGMGAPALAESAWGLIRIGRSTEAIPFIARFERLAPATGSDFAWGFAMTYSNATLQVQEQDGLAIPATRSSVERVALAHEFLRQLDAGERRATDSEQKRNFFVARAGLIALWGFAREGYADYRRANEILALTPRGSSNAHRLEQLFIDPTAEPR